jgi:hypothetical protein
MVAPPAHEPGQDTSAISASRLDHFRRGSATGFAGAFARVTGLASSLSGCFPSQVSGVVCNIANARKFFPRFAWSAGVSRFVRSICPAFTGFPWAVSNGLKHIYQCKVLTGEFAVGNQNMIVPPPHPGGTTKKYDSTVENATKPTIFVIFYDTQAFPEYLVYFK